MFDTTETPQQYADRERSAARIFLVTFAITIVIGIYYTILLIQRNTPFSYGEPNVQAFIIAFASLISYWMLRQKQLTLSVFVFLSAFSIGIAVSALHFGGLDIILSLILLLIFLGVGSATLPKEVFETLITFSVFLSVLIGFIGYWDPLEREYLPADPVTYIFAGSLIVIYGIILARQYRRYSVRTKLVLSFAILSAVGVGAAFAIANFNIQRVLSQNGQQSLLAESELSADKFDAFLQYNMDAVNTASAYLDMRTYLSLEPEDRRYSQAERQVENVLYGLKNRDRDILSYGILDLDGTVIIDSRTVKIGTSEANFPHYIAIMENAGTYISPVQYLPEMTDGVFYISTPIYSEMGILSGILRAEYSAAALQQLFTRQENVAELDSFYVLFDENNVILAHERLPELIGAQPSATTLNALTADDPFFEMDDTLLDTSLAGAITKLSNAPWTMVAFQSQDAFTLPVRRQAQIFFLLAVGTILFAVIAGAGFSNLFTAPILRLRSVAQQFTEGDLNAHATIETEDEVGQLAETFNALATRLQGTVLSLEDRVEERTYDLELRSRYLEGAAEIGRLAATITNADELSSTVVESIRSRFDLYYVGLFLADENREWAVLQAGTGVAGEVMLSNNHRLKIGEGMIGWTVENGEARIALDVGEDAVRFDNPVLPETRSEGALPLRSRGRVLGAITVQSTQPSAFSLEILTTLQTMADQIAVAFDNARLFKQTEEALEAERRAYGELTLQSWQDMKKRKRESAFRVDGTGRIKTLSESVTEARQKVLGRNQTLQEDGRVVTLPIKSRGYVIGGIRIAKSQGKLTSDQLQLITTLSDQLSVALESARLFEDTQSRAQREAVISDISAKVGASIRMDTILKTTVQELGMALSGADISFEITGPEEGAKPKA